MTLKNAGTSIHKIAGLSDDDAAVRDQICELIDQLRESIATAHGEPPVVLDEAS